MMTVIFKPVAQNTIIRPMAQAVSLVHGGEPVTYIDTADKKEKTITHNDLTWLDLTINVKDLEIPVEANLVAFRAKHGPVQVHVLVNDIIVKVISKTTVQQAMAQFRRKLSTQNRIKKVLSPARQRN